MSELKGNCDTCEQEVIKNIGQTIIDRQLRFYLSYRCPFCDTTIELDEIGFPEEHFRQVFLKEQGKYQLKISFETNTDRMTAIKAVRQILQLSIAQVAKLFDISSAPFVSEGIKLKCNGYRSFYR